MSILTIVPEAPLESVIVTVSDEKSGGCSFTILSPALFEVELVPFNAILPAAVSISFNKTSPSSVFKLNVTSFATVIDSLTLKSVWLATDTTLKVPLVLILLLPLPSVIEVAPLVTVTTIPIAIVPETPSTIILLDLDTAPLTVTAAKEEQSKIDEQLIDSQTNDSFVTTKTTLYIGDTPYSVGHARESFNSSFINKTSAVENAFTSSLGRCLAAFGLHGSEFASAEEVANAINNQPTKKDSIEVEIEKQSTETKLNTLYSNWITKNEKIDELFKTKQESIKTNGGSNAKW